MKKAALLFVLLALAAGGYFLWKDKKADNAQGRQGAAAGMPAPEVAVMTIRSETIRLTRDLPGRTSSYRVAEIRPQVSGIIRERLFEEGANVEKGQQLYLIDPSTYQATYNSARADLMKAEASLKAAQSNYNRNKELVSVGAVSKQAFDDIKAALEQARADVEIAKASLASAKINLDYTKVHSPISGRIGKSLVTEGALVTANQTAPLANVQQFDPMYVDVTQSSGEVMDLRRQSENMARMPVSLLLDGGTRVYGHKGEIQFSDITVDQTTGSVQVRILFPNPEGELLPGLFVRARIEQTQKDNAVLVPQKAATRDAGGDINIWVVGADDKVSPRKIKADQAVGDRWLVTEGLQAGERIVVEGIQKVQAGMAVKPAEVKNDAGARTQQDATDHSASGAAAQTGGAAPETNGEDNAE